MSPSLEDQVGQASDRWQERWDRGPTRTRWSEVPLQVGDPAPSFDLPATTGAVVRLRDLWRDGPALLLFWRHFGCSCGVDRARRLQQELPTYDELGARVAIIGEGEPERAAVYAANQGLDSLMILSDPEAEVYRAYGLLEGQPAQLLFDAPEDWLDHRHDTGAAFRRQRAAEGRPPVDSPWQLPGEFVIAPGGVVALTYRYNYCEDFPDPRVHYAALRQSRKETS